MAPRPCTREQAQVGEALASSLELGAMLAELQPALRKLVPADAAAVGVFGAGGASAPTWIVDNLPPTYFAAYGALGHRDFVRDAVSARPGVVLRDDEMIARRELERHVLYQRAREVGAPLEQVMAVMLHADQDGASGLALYRDRRRPFSARDRRILQQWAPALARAIRHCLLHGRVARQAAAFAALNQARDLATMLVRPNGELVHATPAAEAMLAAWFAAQERGAGSLPRPLATHLTSVAGGSTDDATAAPGPWRRRLGPHVLEISFLPLPSGEAGWLLLFEVRHRPLWCESLTNRQRQVFHGLINGWDNRLLAEELQCSVETIKKHVAHVLERAGVDNRHALAGRRYDL